jgi:glycosyltransferase involved in cell wall biosynthesis
MKIVHVVESLDIGGLEKVVIALAAWQRSRGHASRIVCLFHEGALAAEARATGLSVQAVNKRPGFDLAALRTLRRDLAEGATEVVHTHNPVAHYYAAAGISRLGARQLVNTRHGMGAARDSRQLRLLYRAALLKTGKVVAVCHAARERFVRTGTVPAALATVIPNGVAIERIAPRSADARTHLLRQLGLPEGTLLLGTVGRLNAVKDHATLLRSVAQLRAGGRAVDLLVIGDGELRSALETQARSLQLGSCVHFMGMRADVGRLLAGLDLFVLSSLTEGYSLALVEAATAALPIVATQVGGNADIVQHGATGLLVPASDAAALAAAITGLDDDPELRARMGQAGRAWALRHGSVEAMGLAYQGLYDALMAPKVRQ